MPALSSGRFRVKETGSWRELIPLGTQGLWGGRMCLGAGRCQSEALGVQFLSGVGLWGSRTPRLTAAFQQTLATRGVAAAAGLPQSPPSSLRLDLPRAGHRPTVLCSVVQSNSYLPSCPYSQAFPVLRA